MAMVKGVRPLDAMPKTTSWRPGLALLDRGEGEHGVIFAGFSGSAESLGTSGHDVLHGAWIGVEGGRNFRGVESAEAAAGSGAHIDEASTLADAGGDQIDGAGNLRKRAAHCGGDGGIFVVHEAGDFERRHLIETARAGKNLFGGKVAKIGFRGAGSSQVLRLSNWVVDMRCG